MDDDAPDCNPWFLVIRKVKQCAAVCLENGWTVEGTRAMLLDHGGAALPDDEPLRSWAGSLLTRAIDEQIYRTMARIHGGA